MADDDQAGTPQGEDTGPDTGGGSEQGKPSEQKPPWGSDDEFDPEKAWKLIQNVRADAEKAKADRDSYKGKVDEVERGKLSEQEKLAADLNDYKSRAEQAEGQLLRMEVAASKGLTPAQAKRLQGSSKEELEADADDLLSTFTPASGGVPSNRPREQYKGGSSDPGEAPEELDPAKLAALVRGNRR